ncbi:MAG TPA: FkbM family methyltransferase [Verrucomicrobiae bacterium]|nr:FkbM family methyltransferase [Verrucomicrobiae bacterium]
MNYIIRSLELDFQFLKISKLTLFDKILFIINKYYVLFKNLIVGFQSKKSFAKVFGKKFYFEDKFGTAFLQSVYVDNHFLNKFIEPDSTIVDVGANIGQFNFFCFDYLKAKTVYSFEPVKETFEILKLNNNTNVYNYAISNLNDLSLGFDQTSLTASPFFTDSSRMKKVTTKKLDDIDDLKKESKIDLLKIDTEGTELDVLKASREILQKTKYILIEASIVRESSGNATELIKFLLNIIPSTELVYVGRPYIHGDKMTAVDLLFINNNDK